MKYEKSCGVAVFRDSPSGREFLLVCSIRGCWGFPKGHVEPGETEMETALRELREETNAQAELIPEFRKVMEYSLPGHPEVKKKVVLFLGRWKEGRIIFQKSELQEAAFFPFNEAIEMLPFPQMKKILSDAEMFLNEREKVSTAERPYYDAYDDRYRQAHRENLEWFSRSPSLILHDVMDRFDVQRYAKMLELGCGEGRDAIPLLQQGYNLLATDISREAVSFCQKNAAEYSGSFRILNCVSGDLPGRFDFIFAIAVLHMLVTDADRDGFFHFIHEHLSETGIALVCSMGDGTIQRQTDIAHAFDLQERTHGESGRSIRVAATSCRMVSFETLRSEISRNKLKLSEQGITHLQQDFGDMDIMYAVVKRDEKGVSG